MTLRRAAAAIATVTLLAATVGAFVWFDNRSHSVSDTIRPFLLTVVPLWSVAIVAGSRLRRHP
jgi:hypothetical protein